MKNSIKLLSLMAVLGCNETQAPGPNAVAPGLSQQSGPAPSKLPRDTTEEEKAAFALGGGSFYIGRGNSIKVGENGISDYFNASSKLKVQTDGNACFVVGGVPKAELCTMKFMNTVEPGFGNYNGDRLVQQIYLSNSGSLFLSNTSSCYVGQQRPLARSATIDDVNYLAVWAGQVLINRSSGAWEVLSLKDGFSMPLAIGCVADSKL